MWEAVIAGVVTSLVTVIVVLVGLIKFILPKKNNPGNHNQDMKDIKVLLQDIKTLLEEHHTMFKERVKG